MEEWKVITSKKLNENTLNVVNGYIRKKQLLLPFLENNYYIIPSLVIHLILLYYFDGEYFATNPVVYEISNDRKIIKKTMSKWGPSIYGNISIPSTGKGVYFWIFKILHPCTSTTFGITSDINNDEQFWSVASNSNYGAMYAGHKASKGKMEWGYPKFTNFEVGTLVKMELNLSRKELIFYIDDKCLGPVYTNIDVGEDIKYKMAIDMIHLNGEIQFIEFSSSLL